MSDLPTIRSYELLTRARPLDKQSATSRKGNLLHQRDRNQLPFLSIYTGDVRRLHLFEFGDQRWFPRILRDAETAYLTAAYRFFPALPRRWAEKISIVLHPGEPVESSICVRALAARCPRL